MPAPRPALSMPPELATLAMRHLPLAPLQALLTLCLRRIQRQHPQIFDRLGCHADKHFGLEPTDLPIAFVLEPSPPEPKVTVVRNLPPCLDAHIAGPLAALIGLVDGEQDGDALFFSRDLEVEGDIEAVLALRNAVDNARINLIGEALAWLGPLAAPGERALRDLISGGLLQPRRSARAVEQDQWS